MDAVPGDSFTPDFVRLKTSLDKVALANGKPEAFRVVASQTNLNLVVRYGDIEHGVDDLQANNLLINPELLREFAFRFLK